jgi:hypothetical protein
MPLGIMAQTDRLGEDVQYGFSLRGTSGGGDNAPFWFTNNRYGLGPVDNHTVLARAYIKRDAEADSLRFWRVGYGADMAAGYGNQSEFCIQQLFLDVQWKMLRLSMGQKERPSEFKNEELSTGGMTLGMNARPLPQVRLELPDFWEIPGMKGWFAIKAHIAYGMYTDNRWQRNWNAGTTHLYTQNSLFHSKALFMKIGNVKKFPLTLKWGLEMACQFGGKGYNLLGYDNKPIEGEVSLSKNIIKAFIPSGGDVNDDAFSNASGNHLGSWHFRLDWTGKNWSVGGYMDHLFEDHSQLGMQYGFWKDMLLGIEVNLPENRFVSSFVYEHLGTMNQSGPLYHDATVENPQQISANDAYYNNHVYGSWQHGGFVMGNPLIMSPMYNDYLGLEGMLNNYFNRVNAHHVGIKGNPTPWISWRVLYTYEKNLGSYDKPVMDPLKGHFLLLEGTYKPKKLRGLGFTLAYGHNHGSLLGKANSAMLTVSFDGWIRKYN